MNEITYLCSTFVEDELLSSFLEEELFAFEDELLIFLEEELFAFEDELLIFLEEELFALTEEELLALEEELFAFFTTEEELFGSSAGALEPESSPQPASIKPSAAVRIRDL